MTIRVLLADDHGIVRHGLCRSLQQEKDMEVVGQASDGHSVVHMTRQIMPDVVIMDIGMRDLNGIEATRQILKNCAGMKVVALSMHSARKYIIEMFRAGASGYLLKDCPYSELATAIRIVAQGKIYISPSVSDVVVQNYIQHAQQEESAYSVLTQREREVLQLMAEGKSTKQVAAVLCISPKTVEAHRLKIMEKIGLNSLAELTKYAIQEGLTLPDP